MVAAVESRNLVEARRLAAAPMALPIIRPSRPRLTLRVT